MLQVRVILIGGGLDYRSFTVVGIMPASFRYPVDAPPEDVWIPVAQDPLFGPLTSQPGVRFAARDRPAQAGRFSHASSGGNGHLRRKARPGVCPARFWIHDPCFALSTGSRREREIPVAYFMGCSGLGPAYRLCQYCQSAAVARCFSRERN